MSGRAKRPVKLWATNPYEYILAAGAVVLLVAVLAALARGRAHWGDVPASIWLHLATIVVALALTPVMLLRDRGDRFHRRLGWLWAGSLVATAALSFLIRTIDPGRLSFIHLLSAATLLMVPRLVYFARTHNVRRHRLAVQMMVTGALLIAGFFTFPFNRMLGNWLFG